MRVGSLLIAALILAAPAADAAQTPTKKPVAARPAGKPAPKPAAKPAAKPVWTSVVVRTPDGYRMGNPDAAVKLVEYGSRTCPVCGAFGREATKPLEEMVKTGKLSWEFREFLVHGQPDIAPAMLGRCIGTAKFFPVLERMYIEQDPIEEKLRDPAAPALAEKMQRQPALEVAKAWADYLGYYPFMAKQGMTAAQAQACLADTKELDTILRTMGEAQESLNVHGTPSFFINDKPAENAYSWATLQPLLQAAGL
jgi:protein-disulfide isomerase